MRLLRMQRIWQLKVIFTACVFAALIVGGGHTLAQMRQASERLDRDDRRIERRIDGLQKDFEDLSKRHDALNLDLEKRLTSVETYMGIGIKVLGLVFVGVFGQLGIRLFDLITQRRAAGKGGGE